MFRPVAHQAVDSISISPFCRHFGGFSFIEEFA
jgi:hypothetical protein